MRAFMNIRKICPYHARKVEAFRELQASLLFHADRKARWCEASKRAVASNASDDQRAGSIAGRFAGQHLISKTWPRHDADRRRPARPWLCGGDIFDRSRTRRGRA